MPAAMALVLLVSAIVSSLLLGKLIPILRVFFNDTPNLRSSHSEPTPSGGGLAFVLLSAASSLTYIVFSGRSPFAVLVLVCTPLAIIGLVDDRLHLSALFRFCSQLFTSLAILSVSSPFHNLAQDLHSELARLACIIGLALMVTTSVINFTNFMDGLDGLVAGCMMFSIGSSIIQLSAPWPLWVLIGSVAGFLLWNWSPAKVFMGDVGSTFLGAIFAGLILQASSWKESLCFLLVATPILADASVCVVRRFFSARPVFEAHRSHLYQRLHQSGWHHSAVSSLYITATGALAIGSIFGGLPFVMPLALGEILVGAWLDYNIATPFSDSL